MKELLRKELRLETDVLLGTLVLLVASFPLAFMGIYMQGIKPFPWVSAMAGGCILNQYTLVLTAALLGAAAFAREREEGNVHFLAFLPITPLRQYAAKILSGMIVWSLLWALNAVLMIGITLLFGVGLEALLPVLPRMLGSLVFSFAAFGFASFAGCYISSVTGAAFASLAAVMSIGVARLFVARVFESSEFASAASLILIGVISLATLVLTGIAFARGDAPEGRFASRAKREARLRFSGLHFEASSATAALVWKDARLLSSAIAVGMVLLLLPFIAAAGNAALSDEAASGFRTASLITIALGWIVFPLWSASSLGSEWSSLSDQFLSYLPVSSNRILGSKFIVAAVPAAFVSLVCVVSFSIAQSNISGEPAIHRAMSWDEFGMTGFLPGALAYACALPVTFAIAWYFAARLRRKIVAIVLGILSGPVAMASWAIGSLPEGYLVEHFSPIQAAGIHATILGSLSVLLLFCGARRLTRDIA